MERDVSAWSLKKIRTEFGRMKKEGKEPILIIDRKLNRDIRKLKW